MVEFHIKIHPEQRLTRIPKLLAQTFGNTWILVPNTKAAIIFAENTDLETVQKSLAIIQQDIQLRIESRPRANARGVPAK